MFDPHVSETVSDLNISRDAPFTVGTSVISVHTENVSGAVEVTGMSLPATKISVTSWTIAKKSTDPGLLFSRSLKSSNEEDLKSAKRELLEKKRRPEDKEVICLKSSCLGQSADSCLAQAATIELVHYECTGLLGFSL